MIGVNQYTMENLPQPVEYSNQRILTSAQLAELYETDVKHIKQNFSNNKDRYVVGKHYFYLEGEELKGFKNLVEKIDLVDKRAPNLYLWTEKGALLHAKSLGTDKAWEVYEWLVDTYFRLLSSHQEQPRHQFNFKYQERLHLNKNVRLYGYFPVTKFFDDINSQFLEDVIVLSETSSPDISLGKFLASRLPLEPWYDSDLVKKPVGGYDRSKWNHDIIMTVYVKDGYPVKREVTHYPLEWHPASWHIVQNEYFAGLFPKYLGGTYKGMVRCADEAMRKYIAERVNYFIDR